MIEKIKKFFFLLAGPPMPGEEFANIASDSLKRAGSFAEFPDPEPAQ